MENYDSKKRKIIDAACAELVDDQAEKVRDAVMQVDMLALRRKFQGFVLDHITEQFYRGEAIDSTNPIRAVDLPKALDFAYQVRSKTVHELRDLAPELRELAQQNDTVWHDGKMAIPLRHPRDHQSPPAPELWRPTYSDFQASECPRIFSALVESLRRVSSGETDGVVDLRVPLERIEALLPGEAKDQQRLPMIATYLLWHAMVTEELERPDAERFLDPYVHLLDAPSMYSYALWAFGGQFSWDESALVALADERESLFAAAAEESRGATRSPRRHLHIDLARRAWIRGDQTKCLERVGKAIELLPGD